MDPMSKPATRRMLPRSMRRAVAIAIELERTHDCLCAFDGSITPIADRIAVTGSTTTRRSRIALPRELTLDVLTDMQRRRVEAIEEAYDRIGPTLSHDEAAAVDGFVDEARALAGSEQTALARPKHRRTRTSPLDAMSDDERTMLEIAQAADRVEKAAAPLPRPRWTPPRPTPSSISIELLMAGLLDHHGTDRGALYAELDEIRRSNPRKTSIDVASASTRSNYHTILHSLGPSFPPATFRLRGPSLDTMRIELQARDAQDGYDVWTYLGGYLGRPSLIRHSGVPGMRLDTFPLRPLAEALGDERFHEHLIVQNAHRERSVGEGAFIKTCISLFPRYALLDPPGVEVKPVPRVMPSDIPAHVLARRDITADVDYEAIILEGFRRLGHVQRTTIRARADGGIDVNTSHPDSPYRSVFYDVPISLLRQGSDALDRRIADIVDMVNAAVARRREESDRRAARMAETAARREREAEKQRDAAAEEKRIRQEQEARWNALMEGRRQAMEDDIRNRMALAEKERSDREAWARGIAERHRRTGPAPGPFHAGTSRIVSHPGTRQRMSDALAGRDDLVAMVTLGRKTDALTVEMMDGLWRDRDCLDRAEPDFDLEEGCLVLKSARFGEFATYSFDRFDRTGGLPTHVVGSMTLRRDITDARLTALQDGMLSDFIKWQDSRTPWPIRRVSRAPGGAVATFRMPLYDM